jgi:hypothetical protein
LTAGPAYTITMWGVTAWGDVSSPASTTYTIVPRADSTIYNNDFDIPNPANRTIPDGWAIVNNMGGTAVFTAGLTTAAAYARTYGFRIDNTSGSASAFGNYGLLSRRFAVRADRTYITSVKARNPSGQTGSLIWFEVTVYDASGSSLGTVLPALTLNTTTTSWAEMVSGAFTMPANATQATLRVFVTGWNPAVGAAITVDLDQVYWIEQTDTPDYKDASITTAKFVPGAVDSLALGAGAVASKIQFGSGLTPLQRGSSNPLMLTDDVIHRTDKDRIGTYNGTQVVSVAPISIPWLPNSSLNPFSTSGIDAWYAILPNDMPLYLERWTCLVRGNTTNNASNFWTVALQGFTGGAGTTLDSFTTAALTVNALTMQHRALTTALTAGQYDFLALIATKTGAPGTLLLIPHLRAREILS